MSEISATSMSNGIDDLSQSAQDYALVEKAIRYLEEHRREQPELAEIASHVGLSDFHFQRIFSRWAGVSPKRFLQALTVEEARRTLTHSGSMLDAAYDTGLSGPGRLHDLLVQCQAATPGEVKSGGAGLTIHYAIQPTPFGDALLGVTQRGICALSFVSPGEESREVEYLRTRWPAARLVLDEEKGAAVTQRVFTENRLNEPLHLYIKGTNFQEQVWQALLRVPPGSLTTYEDLAQAIGRPSAARAVGGAVGSNAIAWLIPCHRVIRQTGVVDGYRWGTERKRAMLGWEASRAA